VGIIGFLKKNEKKTRLSAPFSLSLFRHARVREGGGLPLHRSDASAVHLLAAQVLGGLATAVSADARLVHGLEDLVGEVAAAGQRPDPTVDAVGGRFRTGCRCGAPCSRSAPRRRRCLSGTSGSLVVRCRW
jgi:hypothetical protein